MFLLHPRHSFTSLHQPLRPDILSDVLRGSLSGTHLSDVLFDLLSDFFPAFDLAFYRIFFLASGMHSDHAYSDLLSICIIHFSGPLVMPGDARWPARGPLKMLPSWMFRKLVTYGLLWSPMVSYGNLWEPLTIQRWFLKRGLAASGCQMVPDNCFAPWGEWDGFTRMPGPIGELMLVNANHSQSIHKNNRHFASTKPCCAVKDRFQPRTPHDWKTCRSLGRQEQYMEPWWLLGMRHAGPAKI